MVNFMPAVLTAALLAASPVASSPVPGPPPAPTAHVWAVTGYAFGYGTYYVATRRDIPQDWGNARNWYAAAQADGYAVGSEPKPGAIAWTDQGLYGLGHVAYVEEESDGLVTVSEMYFNGAWNRASWRTVPASAFKYIY